MMRIRNWQQFDELPIQLRCRFFQRLAGVLHLEVLVGVHPDTRMKHRSF